MKPLINRIKKLEAEINKREINQKKRQSLDKCVFNYIDKFLENLSVAKAYQADFNLTQAITANAISEAPIDISTLLETIEEHIEKPGVNTTSGNYFGYIPCGGLYPAALGGYLSAVINRYSSLFFMSPGAVQMEKTLIEWVSQLIGYSTSAFGNITSGASLATLIAVVTARTAKKMTISNCQRMVVYLGQHTHYCLAKALHIAGLGEVVQRIIPLDKQFKMDILALKKAIKVDSQNGLIPWMVVASAGTTDIGAIDSLIDIHQIAQKYKLWLHVDAAYGGFFMLTASGKQHLAGLNLADSVVLDAHKTLFMPYGIALVLIRSHKKILQAHSYTANILQDAISQDEVYSPTNLSPELTRPFRGLSMWLALQLLGVLAQYFYQKISTIKNIEVACEPYLSIVVFRYIPENFEPNKFNYVLYQKLLADGTIFLSTTTINDNYYLRFACLSFRTHVANVDLAISILKEKIKEVKTHLCI
jgi:aromatic-L-amino-acid decarboxylase